MKYIHLLIAVTLLGVLPVYGQSTDRVVHEESNSVGGSIEVLFVSGTTYSMTALANLGYTFLSWSDGVTTNPRNHTQEQDPNKDKTYYAIFTKDACAHLEHGDVTVAVTDGNVPTYVLTAVSKPGYQFESWNMGESSMLNNLSIPYLVGDGDVFPWFAPSSGVVNFRYQQHVGGIVHGVANGMICTLSASPNEGYEFAGWTDGVADNPRSYTHSPAEEDITFRAIFTKTEDIVRNGGSVAVGVDNADIPSFTLTAEPDAGYELVAWNNGLETTNVSYVEDDGTRVPFFMNPSGQLAFLYEQHPGGVVQGRDVSGDNCNLYAMANPGYEFLYWTDGDTRSVRPYTHTTGSTAQKFHAVFAKTEDIVQAGGQTLVEVADANAPSFRLTANPGACATFYLWDNGHNSEVVSNYTESMGQCKPIFSRGGNAMEYETEDCAGGVILVQDAVCGYVLVPQESYGYAFSHWEDNSTTPERAVSNIEATYTAYFAPYVAKVGDNYYGSVHEAIINSNGEKVELLRDVDEDVVVNTSVSIDGDGYSIGNLTILSGVSLLLEDNIGVNNLYLNATTGSSSQLINDAYLTYNKAYIDIRLESVADAASPNKWYGVAVPFEVDIASGISRVSGSTSHVSGSDYLVCSYDGELRANSGNGWVKTLSGTMQAGKFYMFGIDGTQNVWRFAKKDGSPLTGNMEVPLSQYPSNVIDMGWNAIGNPTLRYVRAAIPGIGYVQVYDNVHTRYLVKLLSTTSFVVGCPFFVQVDANNTMTLSNSSETNSSLLYAPGRDNSEAMDDLFEVHWGNDVDEDVLYVSAGDWASAEYEVGKDVLKLGINSAIPSIWSNDYGKALCAQNARYTGNVAIFNISLLAPSDQEYTLSINPAILPDDVQLFLLQGGQPIWNLTVAPYVMTPSQGNVSNYGLMMLRGSHGVSTKSDEISNDNQYQKFIMNNHVYIMRNGLLYDVVGQTIDAD